MTHRVNSTYRRFIAGPTVNNSKEKVDFFWKLSLNIVENLIFFGFLGNYHLMLLKM